MKAGPVGWRAGGGQGGAAAVGRRCAGVRRARRLAAAGPAGRGGRRGGRRPAPAGRPRRQLAAGGAPDSHCGQPTLGPAPPGQQLRGMLRTALTLRSLLKQPDIKAKCGHLQSG